MLSSVTCDISTYRNYEIIKHKQLQRDRILKATARIVCIRVDQTDNRRTDTVDQWEIIILLHKQQTCISPRTRPTNHLLFPLVQPSQCHSVTSNIGLVISRQIIMLYYHVLTAPKHSLYFSNSVMLCHNYIIQPSLPISDFQCQVKGQRNQVKIHFISRL